MLAPRRRVTLLAAGLATTTLLATSGLVTGSAHAVASRTLFHPYVSTDPTANGADAANVAIGDVSGDGRVRHRDDHGLRQRPGQRIQPLGVPPAGRRRPGRAGADPDRAGYGSVMSVALADLDGDSDLDAAVTTSGGVLLYEQTAVGLVYTSTIPVTGGRDLGGRDLTVTADRPGGEHQRRRRLGANKNPAGPDPFAVAQLSSLKVVEVEVGDVTGDGRLPTS